ncbi:MAG TPA: hypothetical protein VNH63_01725 [Gemmatimonadales bacterium]|nr:hypothetical protein [Gemmatimonadales bacterium]
MPSFRALIERLAKDIPAEFHDGIAAVDVRATTVPHPVHAGVYTLGECVPLEWSGNGADLHSRILLYHGSFRALARGDAAFDWRREAWDTLSHELRHHLEWRANVAALEDYDSAAEENFRRHEGEPFDPLFYRSGERVAAGVYKVDDDIFLEQDLSWHGRRWRVDVGAVPRGAAAFVTLEGLVPEPAGDAVLVIPHRASLFDLFRRPVAPLQVARRVEPL